MNADEHWAWSLSEMKQQAASVRTRLSQAVTQSRMLCLRTLFVALATVSVSVTPGFVEHAKADNGTVMWKNKTIRFNNGTPVGGFVQLTVFPDGSWQFEGHGHDSGFPSYNLTALGFVHTSSGLVLEINTSGHMAGTTESGSRSVDWNESGVSPALQEVWNDIDVVDVNYGVRIDASTLFWQSVGAVGTVLGIISLAE